MGIINKIGCILCVVCICDLAIAADRPFLDVYFVSDKHFGGPMNTQSEVTTVGQSNLPEAILLRLD